jgi:EAL domain-containing protein (putative c-di-GMP-specific phosphodiesterase class I)
MERENRRSCIPLIKLSHYLGYKVVAEGVEIDAAADLLAAMGCDEGQDYLYSRPLEHGDFETCAVSHRRDQEPMRQRA